jgi:hypothetical protein
MEVVEEDIVEIFIFGIDENEIFGVEAVLEGAGGRAELGRAGVAVGREGRVGNCFEVFHNVIADLLWHLSVNSSITIIVNFDLNSRKCGVWGLRRDER